MSLLNPISRAGLATRFNQIVTSEVNSQIQYSVNSKPFPEAPNDWFSSTSSVADTPSTALGNTSNFVITPNDVTSVFIEATRQMTRVRNASMSVSVVVTGGAPWNQSAGPRGVGYNVTRTGITNLSPSNIVGLGNVNSADIASGNIISRNGLDATPTINPNFGFVLPSGFFQNLYDRWEARSFTTVTLSTTVCHASCHGSCHGSRGRR
jgi:hypothetical protein